MQISNVVVYLISRDRRGTVVYRVANTMILRFPLELCFMKCVIENPFGAGLGSGNITHRFAAVDDIRRPTQIMEIIYGVPNNV